MELPYAAGLFDGEGSVTITKPSPGSPRRHRVVVQIAMTHRPTIEAVKARFGGRIQSVNQAKYNPNAKMRFDWRLSDASALEFLELVYPWLITKKRAADIALDFPAGLRGRASSDALLAERESLRLSLGEENRRGCN
jgi:hypothetical protein